MRQRRDATDEGGAYLLALVVLSLLTMIGVGFHLVVQAESESTAAMRERTRSELHARSGLALGTARGLATSEVGAFQVDRPWRESDAGGFREVVESSGLQPLREAPCAYCPIGIGRGWGRRIHRQRVTAQKVAPPVAGEEGAVRSSRSLEARTVVEPVPIDDCSSDAAPETEETSECTCGSLVRWTLEGGEESLRCAVFEIEPGSTGDSSTLVVRVGALFVGDYVLEGSVSLAPVPVDADYDRVVDGVYVATLRGAVRRLQWRADGTVGLGALRVDEVLGPSERPVLVPPRVTTLGRGPDHALILALGRPAEGVETALDSQILVGLTASSQEIEDPVSLWQLQRLVWGQWSDRDLLQDGADGAGGGWWLEIEEDESVLGVEVFGNGLVVVRTERGTGAASAGEGCDPLRPTGFHRLILASGAGLEGERRALWLGGCSGAPFWISAHRALADLPYGALQEPALETGVERLRALSSERCSFGAYSYFVVSERPDSSLIALAELPTCIRQQEWDPGRAR